MVDDKIKVFGCTDEYGNPSGHAFFTAAGHFFVFLDILHSDKEKKYSLPVYYVLLFLTVSLTFLVGFARFYLGLHTINQIVYGWSLGIILAFYFHFCLRDTIIEYVDNYLLSSNHNSSISYAKHIITNSVLAILTFSSQLITYTITSKILKQEGREPEYLLNLRKQSDCDSMIAKNGVFSKELI